MQWDRFFDDLEDQLASEWEAERAALETEAERLRLSAVGLRDRFAALAGREHEGASASFEFVDGTTIRAAVTGVGADWLALEPATSLTGAVIAPFTAISSAAMPHADLLRSARSQAVRPAIAERMTLGFVVRDLARRRVAVGIALTQGRVISGTIDRAGADHLDIALHEPGSSRRADAVTSHRIVPFAAVAWIRLEAGASLANG